VASNDEQIELLIRRFGARTVGSHGGGNHLDADEMNAFAEGFLPPAARANYVSHLADCEDCRRQVANLSIASGAVNRAEQMVTGKPEGVGLWASLAGLFALPMLRYAAFAVVLVAVAGVAFFALRQRSGSPASLIARNEGDQSQPQSAVKPATETNSGGLANSNGSRAENPTSLPAPAATQPPASQLPGGLAGRQEEVRPADTSTAPSAPPEPMKETLKAPDVADKKAEQPVIAAKSPSGYSPAPPGETQGLARVQSQTGGLATSPGGPKQQQQTTQADKATQTERERDANKDARLDDANRKSDPAAMAPRRSSDEKLKGGPSRNMDNMAINNRSSNEVVRTEAPKTEGRDSEDDSQTRSAGGHKFRKQGKAWVDQKFKSSLSLKNVARGSDEFASLDPGLRSIAQQISGEVIVVWKGKAYLIK
jgi:hypothetical protein